MDRESDQAGAMTRLRHLKAEASLLISLCDLADVWDVMTITRALTRLADSSVQCALHFLLRQEEARGRYVPHDADDPAIGCGLIILAMGKMGAGELNFSSDIDLIVFFDAARVQLAEDVEPQPFFVRVTQGISKMLQQRTADGYVFRVDLRLRPDPASTPVALSAAAALNYYEREGRTWERAAMIKARPCAGDLDAGNALLAEISPFVWRKHLDFAALAEVHDMKRQMHAYKGHNEIAIEGHNIKLGRGGIREIEFFAQTQQLIAGGRHPELRLRETLPVLARLVELGWISSDARDEMQAAYVFLRRVEHRLQMMADEQTHSLPNERADVERFACFLGFADRDAFAAQLLHHLGNVQEHYTRLFESAAMPEVAGTALDFSRSPDDVYLLDQLVAAGFKQPRMVAQTVQHWLSGEYRALKFEAPLRAFRTLLPTLIAHVVRGENPDATIALFDRFLQSLQGGARLFPLLAQNPDLVELVALILGAAPRLGDMLARRPQVLDGLIDPSFFGALPSQQDISAKLVEVLGDASSYEDFLDRLRLFGQENLFLIGTRILSGTVSARQAGEAFANVAEGIVATVHRRVEETFAEQYGRVSGQQTAIVAMGRLGGREMTAASDLDLLVIYDFNREQPDSDGKRSLHGAEYFTRLTHRLISAFTTQTNFGILYHVDMRLRPSGRAGPVATHIDAFADYQANEAWTWEHMALTRARVVSASPDFAARIEGIVKDVLQRPRDALSIAADTFEMRRAIATEKGEADIWDIKNAAGGLTDIEFIAQYLQLAHAHDCPDILDASFANVLDKAAQLKLLSTEHLSVLRAAVVLYTDLMQILRLCLTDRFTPQAAGVDLLKLMARASGEPDFSALEARLRDVQAEVREVFTQVMTRA